MAKKARSGEVNKSQAIREVLAANPKMSTSEVMAALAEKGIPVKSGLVYFIKGKLKGRKGRRRKHHRQVAKVAATGNGDALATVIKVKNLAADVGGLKKLKALVDILNE